ncbi:uncharacterized protein LOC131654482 [Vicia villosa]|uniref:uncharacterized protein LOC131654482 n=1 Tax=Vicia villosa TaxID=3911 RepID=UPI00273B063E|nr:uncharacterized protein LOC131654482 [Vicia villosa]
MAGKNDGAIAATLEAMAQTMQNQPNAGARDESHSLEPFQREDPPTFKGNVVEADDRWLETCQRLDVVGEVITWAVFIRDFMRKYYPEDVRGKKEIEFLELKHGNLSVTDYAAKFVEVAKFYPHYNEATVEFSKCIKFESGLHPEIKKAIKYQKIHNFPDLIDSCGIYEEDDNAHYKIISEKRGKHQQNRVKKLGLVLSSMNGEMV